MVEFVGCIILLFILGWFLKVIVESIIWNIKDIKDIFGSVVHQLRNKIV